MENGSPPDLVAKVVLNAVTNESPTLRYLAGKDVEAWLDSKRNMSDEEFYKMMKQNLMKQRAYILKKEEETILPNVHKYRPTIDKQTYTFQFILKLRL